MVALLAITIGSSLAFINRENNYFEITKNLEIFTNIFKHLNGNYVDKLDAEKLTNTGIKAMLKSLDPYTDFIPEQELSDYRTQTTGKYSGIGALISKRDDYVIISEPYEGFPAQKAGLRAGDKLLKAGDVSLKGKTTSEVSNLLKGQPNTELTITIERPGESKPLTKTFTRKEVVINSVPYADEVAEGIGYIRLGSFTDQCSKELLSNIRQLKNDENIDRLILDLRSNPGGLLNEAVSVANIFLEKGTEVVSTRSKSRDWDKSYRTKKVAEYAGLPLVVLIDGGSASAAEIVAGAVQDLDRGIVVGDRSFGKGLVQTTKNIGYNTKMKITTAKYYLPSGRCLQAIDYSGGYSDKLEQVPDSLRTAFKTTNGRTVYDAGGIDPDFSIEVPKYANVTASLITKNLIFDYATEYRIKNPNIATPDKFELSDQDFDAFVQWLSDKDYNYITKSEQVLEKLKQSAKNDKYEGILDNDITKLEEQIIAVKQNDIIKYQKEIKQLLEYEIVSRYFYQKGEIQESLEDDPDLAKAISLLQNESEYQKALRLK